MRQDLEARRRFAMTLCNQIWLFMAATPTDPDEGLVPIDKLFFPALQSLNRCAAEQHRG